MITEKEYLEAQMIVKLYESQQLNIPIVSNCKHSYRMIGHQGNGHYECTKCNHQKSL